MVRDAHNALTDETAPHMLQRPVDAPPPLGPVSATDGVATLRRVLADRHATPASLRAWAGRVSGRSDRRLVLALAGATEAMATHCDQLAARLAEQEAVTADVASACSGVWTQYAVPNREQPGGRRCGLPLVRPSERTRLRHPFDRGSCQSRPS